MPEPRDDDFVGPSLPFEGLLVRVKSDKGGGYGGRMFLIPGSELEKFAFNPADQGQFDKLQGQLIGLEFAIYSPGFVVYASAG